MSSLSTSFRDMDEKQASNILGNVLKESDIFFGGSSVGKGLKKAARYYLQEHLAKARQPSSAFDHLQLPGAADLQADCDRTPLEDSFYILDIGVIVSQVYQWRRFFPRIEPFYAVKCNPDPVIVQTLAILGCNFDCASRQEIRLVQECTKDLPRKPDIVYANPCKARAHLIEAVCRGVQLVTFDNATEVLKCAEVSKKIELVLRIITDDRGSQCRFSTKFGAPKNKWRPLLALAKKCGLAVVGVSFHVGSGCRDASKYELALKDCRDIFDMAEKEFGFKMRLLDIGGGFPGETHSIWNPSETVDILKDDDIDTHSNEGIALDELEKEDEPAAEQSLMFFTEIAEKVAPMVDRLFPVEEGVRVIAEPGRYFVAASCTLCCSVIAARNNALDTQFSPEFVDDIHAAHALDSLTRKEEKELVNKKAGSTDMKTDGAVLSSIQAELADYTKLMASQQLVQQEFDVYNDKLDLYEEGFDTAKDLLGPPETYQLGTVHHTAEGMTVPLVEAATHEMMDANNASFVALAAAGEAAMSGMMMQAVADSSPSQDDYAYYVNDGCYGALNNLIFDHAHVRPRVLQHDETTLGTVKVVSDGGFQKLEAAGDGKIEEHQDRELFSSTVFGPTCDSIDVISRSVLLPKMTVGDWMYFQNMGAYTMAAASTFNGFDESPKFYVCSVQPEFFEDILIGPSKSKAGTKPSEAEESEEKKSD